MQQGVLYIVATPIGNLEDITFRAIRILKEVQVIAAEDTRRTAVLLRAYDIKTPLTSLYDHNERSKSVYLIDRMIEGENVAYVSDAGTPGISDPGYVLICQAIDKGIQIIPIPGVSAAIAALSVSGLPMDTFVFYGFLPSKSRQRKSFLDSIRDDDKTLVFYESPKRLSATLKDMELILGNRRIVVLREMTKVYEEIIRGTVVAVTEALSKKEIRGEITLVVSGQEAPSVSYTDDEIYKRLEIVQKEKKLSRRDVIDAVTRDLGISRTQVYRVANLLFS